MTLVQLSFVWRTINVPYDSAWSVTNEKSTNRTVCGPINHVSPYHKRAEVFTCATGLVNCWIIHASFERSKLHEMVSWSRTCGLTWLPFSHAIQVSLTSSEYCRIGANTTFILHFLFCMQMETACCLITTTPSIRAFVVQMYFTKQTTALHIFPGNPLVSQ